ncbi:hypothetical protein HCY55_04665 [Limosilactobacillus fermentum]
MQTANLLIATLLLIAGIIVIYLGVFAKEIEHPTGTNRLFQRLSRLGIKLARP